VPIVETLGDLMCCCCCCVGNLDSKLHIDGEICNFCEVSGGVSLSPVVSSPVQTQWCSRWWCTRQTELDVHLGGDVCNTGSHKQFHVDIPRGVSLHSKHVHRRDDGPLIDDKNAEFVEVLHDNYDMRENYDMHNYNVHDNVHDNSVHGNSDVGDNTAVSPDIGDANPTEDSGDYFVCSDVEFAHVLEKLDPSGVGLNDFGARDLLRKLLKIDAKERISAVDALDLAWFSEDV